jgi:hypothetical protein
MKIQNCHKNANIIHYKAYKKYAQNWENLPSGNPGGGVHHFLTIDITFARKWLCTVNIILDGVK